MTAAPLRFSREQGAAAPAVAPALDTVDDQAIRFHATRAELLPVLLRGTVLAALTLGLYRFWFISRLRAYFWSRFQIGDDYLDYTGTGRELILGFFLALAVVVPFQVILALAFLDLGLVGPLAAGLSFLALAVFGQFALYRARRYRLARTVYRGLTFAQDGSGLLYAGRSGLWWTATLLSFGLLYPFMRASQERYMMRHTRFGALRGAFEGSAWRFLWRGFLLWLLVATPILVGLALVLLGLATRAADTPEVRETGLAIAAFGTAAMGAGAVWGVLVAFIGFPWFRAIELRWWIEGLRLGPVRLRSKFRARSLYGAYLQFAAAAGAFGAVLAVPLIGAQQFLTQETLRGLGLGAGLSPTPLGIALLVGFGLAYILAIMGYGLLQRLFIQFGTLAAVGATTSVEGLSGLDDVEGTGPGVTGFGEGLADALHVGGL